MKEVKVLILTLMLVSTIMLQIVYSSSLNLTAVSDKQVYNVGENVTIIGNLTENGLPIEDSLVALEVDNPKNETFIIRTITTGQAPSGPWPVEIAGLTPCDSNGSPIYNFKKGGNLGFKFSIVNNAASNYHVIVALNLYYCNGAPFEALITFNGTLYSGQNITVIVWPILIPSDAVTGTAIAYASLFNDMPKNGGLAYCPEKSATFDIESENTPKQTVSSQAGSFNLTFPLASIPIHLGNYTIYAITYYSLKISSCKSVFKVIFVGDLNNDGKIDMKDIARVAKAFGTQPGDLRWDPETDLNMDGKVDMKDIAIVARAFGVIAIVDP